MAISHQKKLQSIQDKMKALQEEHNKTEQALGNSLIKALQSKNALSLDVNTLVGGIFSVIDKINSGDIDCEAWQKTGSDFLNKKGK